MLIVNSDNEQKMALDEPVPRKSLEAGPTASGRHLYEQLRQRGADVAVTASHIVGSCMQTEQLELPGELSILDGSLAVLGGQLREILGTATSSSNWTGLAEASAILAEVHSVRYEINDFLVRERLRRFAVLESGLIQLRRIHDPDRLLARVCEAVVACCEFDRVLLSQVEGSTWRPWRSYAVAEGPAERAFRNWLTEVPEIRLEHLLLESEMIRRREATIVFPTTDGRRISPSFAEVSELTSYVAAPLQPAGEVIGFLHADYQHRDVNNLDLDVLAAFALAFDQVFERAVLLRRLEEQREQIRITMQSVDAVLDQFATAEIAFAARNNSETLSRGAKHPMPSSGLAELEALLTRRELEVLTLMATGGTNSRIAEKLVITPDTVKSHVKRILRKLRVDNRAEAISKYLRLTLGRNET